MAATSSMTTISSSSFSRQTAATTNMGRLLYMANWAKLNKYPLIWSGKQPCIHLSIHPSIHPTIYSLVYSLTNSYGKVPNTKDKKDTSRENNLTRVTKPFQNKKHHNCHQICHRMVYGTPRTYGKCQVNTTWSTEYVTHVTLPPSPIPHYFHLWRHITSFRPRCFV